MPNFTAHSSAISENDKSEAVYTLVMSNMKNDNTAQFNNIDTKMPRNAQGYPDKYKTYRYLFRYFKKQNA